MFSAGRVVSAVSQRWLVMVSPMLTKRISGVVAVVAVPGLLAACGSEGSDDGSGGGSGDDVASLSDDKADEQAQGDADADAELLDWVGVHARRGGRHPRSDP
jgi:hypothetical protein